MSSTISNVSPMVNVSLDPDQNVNKSRTRYEAIQICEEKYRGEFHRKRWITMAIAVGGIAMLVIPVVALALMAISVTTFNVGLIVAIPAVLIIASVLVKKIEKRTHYWTGKLAENMLQIKEAEAAKKAKKLENAVAVKEEPVIP